ncbi:ribonuclease HII [Candidatus Woesearchaeota archaeon]|nr:ribonuclease HII [Candidatus Woesearchaeota archaeon]
MVIVAGVDEAGRGPVIGPMVMAICAIDESEVYMLEDLGVKDSKQVLPQRREALVSEIKKICQYELIVLSPQDIDNAVFSKNTNLNWLEADTTVKLMKKIKADKYYIDCPSSNPKAYEDYLSNKLSTKSKLVVEHKADVKYLVSSAASILAKVKRDSLIEGLKKDYKVSFGSGYPADPATQAFLRSSWNKKELSDIFRKSWASYRALSKGKDQRKLSTF